MEHVMTRCPRCGKENPEGARFCGGCGLRLADGGPAGKEGRPSNVSTAADARTEKELEDLERLFDVIDDGESDSGSDSGGSSGIATQDRALEKLFSGVPSLDADTAPAGEGAADEAAGAPASAASAAGSGAAGMREAEAAAEEVQEGAAEEPPPRPKKKPSRRRPPISVARSMDILPEHGWIRTLAERAITLFLLHHICLRIPLPPPAGEWGWTIAAGGTFALALLHRLKTSAWLEYGNINLLICTGLFLRTALEATGPDEAVRMQALARFTVEFAFALCWCLLFIVESRLLHRTVRYLLEACTCYCSIGVVEAVRRGRTPVEFARSPFLPALASGGSSGWYLLVEPSFLGVNLIFPCTGLVVLFETMYLARKRWNKLAFNSFIRLAAISTAAFACLKVYSHYNLTTFRSLLAALSA